MQKIKVITPDMTTRTMYEVLENILKHGHGGGNWRRIVMTEMEKAKHQPVPCCGHGCCCNYTPAK